MVAPIAPAHPARVVRAGAAYCRVVGSRAAIGYRPTIPVVYPEGHRDQLLIVKAVTEEPLAEVRSVSVDSPSWVHNGVGSMGFSCSTWDDAMDHLLDPATVSNGAGVMKLIGREAQWIRDGVLRWAGPIVTGAPNMDGTVRFDCMDLGWYLSRKFFGLAERRDLLLGAGSMDAPGLPGWVVDGCTKTRDLTDKVRGVGSMKLSGTGSVSISFTRGTTSVDEDLACHLTIMAKLPSGLPVGRAVAAITVRGVAGGAIVSQEIIRTTEDTKLGSWQQMTATASNPPGAPHFVTVTLYSTSFGDAWFDDVRSLENDTTGYPNPGRDLAVHGVAGVNHVQSISQGGGFGLRPIIITPTGTVEVMGERHLEHAQFQDFLAKYTDRADGFDWRINPRTREIAFSRRIGVDHLDVQLHGRTVRAGGWVHDESELSSKVVVPGEGSDVDRAEGGYTNTAPTAGLTLDYFHQPPNSTPLSALDPMARQVWEQKSQPQITFDGLAISDDYLGTVNAGDRISGSLQTGKFRLPFDTPVRIGTVSLDIPAGQLVLT